ncbi:MAG: virulence RhuM family protein [Planctomycetes bacterium]|nr:virulence RhuM family protein [Planctomycetota bacterium]
MEKTLPSKGEIVIYRTKNGPQLEVKLQTETVWLNQQQMALLFSKAIPTINEHIKNVYKEGELKEKPTIRKFRIVQREGNRQITREVDFYNLDVIISVGYRVKSQQGTRFRIWATKTLKGYIIKGYAINQKRLLKQEQKLLDLRQAIDFLQSKTRHRLLAEQSVEILTLLSEYAKSITLLEQYDARRLVLVKGRRPGHILTYEECCRIIARIKAELIAKKQASDLFGREMDHKFEGVVKNLYQTFGGRQLYPSIEEKATHLLYLTIN